MEMDPPIENVETEDEEEEEENREDINRLPDDVLSTIFTRLKDAKCLMRCYIVSRRFASVVTRVKITHFTITNCNFEPPHNQNSQAPATNFRAKILNALTKCAVSKPLNYMRRFSIPGFIPAPAPPGLSLPDAARFLDKFREIENVFVYIPGVDEDELVIKWEAVLAKDFDYFLVLIASNVRETDPDEDEALDMRALGLTTSMFKSRLELASECFRDALWRHHSTRHIIGDGNAVQAVLFADTKNEGTLYLCRGQVRDLLSAEPKETFDLRDTEPDQLRSRLVKLWHVPLLHLPVCGRTMEGATLVLISQIHHLDQDDIIQLAFREDEVFSEAAMEIYHNHHREGYALTVNTNIKEL